MVNAKKLFNLIADNWPGEMSDVGERELKQAIRAFEAAIRLACEKPSDFTTFAGNCCALCGRVECRGGCFK